jgi:hypothetical protein
MSSPFWSALGKLDGSLHAIQSQVDALRAGLEIDDAKLSQSLMHARRDVALLRNLIRSERPDAKWNARTELDMLIHDLEIDAQQRRNEQRRMRLLDLADEFEAGIARHRSESRTTSLNRLRMDAIEQLRAAATVPEQQKELPGPAASEWLHWACNLRDKDDATIIDDLRRRFPALEAFAAEMEGRYWTPGEERSKPGRKPHTVDFDNELFKYHYCHYFNRFPGSFALISPSERANRAVIFVHGFGGDACETWSNFHSLVDDLREIESWSGATDFFFFDYRAVWERIESSVDRVLEFIKAIIPSPDSTHFEVDLNPILAVQEPLGSFVSVLPADRFYEKIVLTGHSEGAVVVRKALLRAHAEQAPTGWCRGLLSAHLTFFAPALFGYAPSGLLGVLTNFPGIGSAIDAVLAASPAYQDLKDLEMLMTLRQETEDLAKSTTYQAFHAHILWSRRDQIVKQGKYNCDSTEFVDDRTHITVCKPDGRYTLPITLVVSLGQSG